MAYIYYMLGAEYEACAMHAVVIVIIKIMAILINRRNVLSSSSHLCSSVPPDY